MAGEKKKSEVRAAAGVLRPIVVTLIVVSGVVNVLALTGSFYMLQVYDRILTSHSVPTLVALSLLAAMLFLFQGGLEVLRGQVLVRLASRMDRRLTPLAHGAVMRLRSFAGAQGNATQPIRDVDCHPRLPLRARADRRSSTCRGCRSMSPSCSSCIRCWDGSPCSARCS